MAGYKYLAATDGIGTSSAALKFNHVNDCCNVRDDSCFIVNQQYQVIYKPF